MLLFPVLLIIVNYHLTDFNIAYIHYIKLFSKNYFPISLFELQINLQNNISNNDNIILIFMFILKSKA